ncbi:MAG TPA: sialidase family protein [Myxococcota bacterium]|nr:sialidase family protein [Myxococcota bacterium]
MTFLLLLALAGGAAWLYFRPNRARIAPALELESWDVVADGQHNSNTDLVCFGGRFLLAHAASPYHMGSAQCRIVVRASADGRRFEPVAELRVEDEDIRDPKFAVIGGRLFLYVLPNKGFYALPYTTLYATSEDGEKWTELRPVEIRGAPERGWLFWRPRTRDGETFYVPAYWNGHGHSILLSSRDGVHWELVSRIWDGEGNDETDFEWLPDGRMLATARLEVTPDRILGNRDASTLLATSAPPYQSWSYARSRVTRLDGPALFAHAGRVFAVARRQSGSRRFPMHLGGALSRKRTALFLVEPHRLVLLSDLPSAGDTSYAGVVLKDGALFASYYTSDPARDWPWLLGMFLRSEIRMARIGLDSLVALADARG